MSKVDVLLGLQWGDEGKGKVVDFLAPKYDIVARFQGGPNAGHTLEFNGIKHVLHQIPSGIFHSNILNVVGNGVVIDPITFAKEIENLKPYDINPTENLVLSNKAQLIIPTHKELDKALEQAKGNQKIGSTLRGIGPTYQDKVGRQGLRIGDIISSDFENKYNQLKQIHLSKLETLNYNPEGLEEFEKKFFESIEVLRQFNICNTEYLLNNSLTEGKNILAEGAQGTLLDIDFGSYPFVTSSNTTTSGACTGLGIAPNKINDVFGIFKAYCTRVGSGPFPTELHNDEGEQLRKAGNEFGATTGRPRRCGWLDIPALNYSIMLNGVTQLYMMKADVLAELDEIKICENYLVNNQSTSEFSSKADIQDLNTNYKTYEGWKLDNPQEFSNLPDELKTFITSIEGYTHTPINLISLGPDRTETILR